MKTIIYVFSGTGTSLAAATRIGTILKETEIVSIPFLMHNRQNQKISTSASRIGFVFPCYFDGLPQLVLSFIQKLKINSIAYVFGIVTAGGSFGNCFNVLSHELEKKNSQLNYSKVLFLSSSYIAGWHYAFTCKTGKRLEKAYKNFNADTIVIANDIKKGKEQSEKTSYIMDKLSHIGRPNKIAKDTHPWDSEFMANNLCIGCGLCTKVCSINNITILDNKPHFYHNCQRCMACIQYCPHNAIMIKGKPVKKTKYHHPDYSAQKMIEFNKTGHIVLS